MWKVTYDDGSTEEFEDITLELVCAYVDDRKNVAKIEWNNKVVTKAIWVLQCRNDDMKHAMLLFYDNEDEAFAEEGKYKKEYKYVALESYTIDCF